MAGSREPTRSGSRVRWPRLPSVGLQGWESFGPEPHQLLAWGRSTGGSGIEACCPDGDRSAGVESGGVCAWATPAGTWRLGRRQLELDAHPYCRGDTADDGVGKNVLSDTVQGLCVCSYSATW